MTPPVCSVVADLDSCLVGSIMGVGGIRSIIGSIRSIRNIFAPSDYTTMFDAAVSGYDASH